MCFVYFVVNPLPGSAALESVTPMPTIPNVKSGFTRIDLVAVTFVAFMAVALLLPGCEQEQMAARRAACMGNEKQLSLALLAYEGQHHHFSGYRQTLADTDVGWGVIILPQIDRNDLWKEWNEGNGTKHCLT